jgi:RND family efflux transporter MFP subunit
MMKTLKLNDMKSNFRKSNMKAFLSLATGLVACATLFGCNKHDESENTVKARPDVATKIKVVPIVSKTLFREEHLPAEIEAYQDVLIYPKIPGFIKWIGVDRGSVVKKDQLMVQMYAPEYLAKRNEGLAEVAAEKSGVAAAESRLEDVEADLKKRQANLLADQSTYQRVYTASLVPGVIADNDVVQWSQTIEQDSQEVNTLIKRVNARNHEVAVRRELLASRSRGFERHADLASYLDITAPFNGYVTDRRMHVGSFVGPDGTGAYPPICRVKQLDLLRIIIPVPQIDTAGVVLGSQVTFSVSAFPGRKFNGTVARISNTLDKETRTMDVELNYLNPDYKVLPGMFCEVFWPTRRHERSLFVPITAVVSTPLQTFICRVKNNVLERVIVRKAEIMNGMVEVFGDIKEGELVAQDATEELQDNSKVEAIAVTPRAEDNVFKQ